MEKQTIANVVNYDDKREPEEAVYYCFHTQADTFKNDMPVLNSGSKTNKSTLAFSVGKKFAIRIDDMGKFVNPLASLKQRVTLDRFATVSKKVFDYYLSFLKTGNKISLAYAEREQV